MKKLALTFTVAAVLAMQAVTAGATNCIEFPLGYPDSFPSDGFGIGQAYGNYRYELGHHSGVDASKNHQEGHPVHAIADGQVTEALNCSEGGGWGTMIRIRHELPDGTVFYSQYAHMECDSLTVQKWNWVSMGDVIGTVGNTGFSDGPHLHFEIKFQDSNGTGYYASHPDDCGFVDPIEFIYENRECKGPEEPDCENCFVPPCGCIINE